MLGALCDPGRGDGRKVGFSMSWRKWGVIVGVLAVWATVAAWQWHEYVHECQLIRATLSRQARSIAQALIGGMRSHRRMGRFFQDQVQKSLEEIVRSPAILALGIADAQGRLVLEAGRKDLLSQLPADGESWTPESFHLVVPFELRPAPPGPGHPWGGRGRGGRGMGELHGFGDDNPFGQGGRFRALLVLDRADTDAQCRRAARIRIGVVALAGLVLGCLAAVWVATLRLAESQSQARMLETETRHLRELAEAASGLAHEIRNPLGLIRGWTQRLAESAGLTAEEQTQTETVLEECDRITARINQFLAYARPCEPEREEVPLRRLIEELAALLQPDLQEAGVWLNWDGVAAEAVLSADAEMLRQALFNLLQNAIEFSPAGATVEITLHSDQDGRWRLDVADRGPGVASDAVGSLFTPYFTTRPNGTGLGLCIVQQIARAHGWQVGYTPRDGGGAVFWLSGNHG